MTMTVRCDKCGKRKTFSIKGDIRTAPSSQLEAKTKAAMGKWEIPPPSEGGRDLCPNCQSKRSGA